MERGASGCSAEASSRRLVFVPTKPKIAAKRVAEQWHNLRGKTIA
jgi:hypothetical protein